MKLNFGTFTLMDLNKTSIAYDSMARSADPKHFWAPPISEFEDLATQTSKTYQKLTIVWMIFGNKLLSSFLMLAINFFPMCLCYRRTQRSRHNVKIHNSSLTRLRATNFLTLLHLRLGFGS